MSNIKKWIILLVILLTILIGILIYTIYQNRGKMIHGVDELPKEITYDLDKTVQKVIVRNNFYIVRECTDKFYNYYQIIHNIGNYYNGLDQKSLIEAQKQNEESIYNMLDSEYIKAKGITKENITTKLGKIKPSIVNITEMYVSEQSDNISVYIVKGTLRENLSNNMSKFTIMVKLDLINRTFAILPQDYVEEKYNNIQIGSNINIEIPDKIEISTSNQYAFRVISDETYARDLFYQYKTESLYSPSLVYNHLDNEYKTKRFGTLEKFQQYTKNNEEKYKTMQLDKYQKTVTDKYTQYVLLDKAGNYYIFRENTVMDYSLILDTYTIDLPEFIEKYKGLTENEKIALNIQKVFEAINTGDYTYVYNKLDNTFKANNFKTEEEFEKYVKEKLYANNKITYEDYQKSGETYIYKIKITDGANQNTVAVNKTIIMQLKEGTDFVMSFNVN